jgi:hypothetical protein
MKKSSLLFIVECLIIICSLFIFACKPDESEADPKTENPADTITVADLDKFSDHLQFFNSVKKPGNTPAAPSGSSLKISIKDTLYVIEGVEMPIKFLHRDTTNNVAGAYVQVSSWNGSSQATYHYDVPEIPEVAQSDTVSGIGFGFNLDGFIDSGGVPPAGGGKPLVFDVTITPYDESGQPLDETVIPVVVDDADDSDNLGSGSCPLVLPEGEHWEWFATITLKPGLGGMQKYVGPEVISGGQYINGCCVDGVSDYSSLVCPPNTPNHRRLFFNTYYQAAYESIIFKDDGTYSRITEESYANPQPEISDFCGNGQGEIEEKSFIQLTKGNWAMERNVSTPQILRDFSKGFDTSDYLRLTPTSITPSGGFIKTRGGFIWQNPCPPASSRRSKGTLGLITSDGGSADGGGQVVIKFFERSKLAGSDDDEWFAFL